MVPVILPAEPVARRAVVASHYYKWHYGNVHYQKRGWGDPLLLVHNVYPGASYEEYERNMDALAKHFTVYAMDLLGFGHGDHPRLKYTSNTYVEQVFDFIREVIEEPAHCISAGLSCAYVSEVAAWRSNLFQKLVFVCPRSEPTGLDKPRWMAPIRHFFFSSPTLGSGFYETMAGQYELRQFLLTCFRQPKRVTRELVNRLYNIARQSGTIYAFASLMTGYLDNDLLHYLPKFDLPILLVWGRQAEPTPVEHSVRLQAVAQNCTLEVIEDAGSWVHDEQSAAVNNVLVEWLNKDASAEATVGCEPS